MEFSVVLLWNSKVTVWKYGWGLGWGWDAKPTPGFLRAYLQSELHAW
jgi:hypothetical protein